MLLYIYTCYDVVHQRGRHAKNADQQVTDGEIEDEQIGDGAHVPAAQHDEAHHSVSHHAHHKDQKVRDGEDCSHRRLMEVEVDVGDALMDQRVFLLTWWIQASLKCLQSKVEN